MEERADKYQVVLLDHEGSKEPNPLKGMGIRFSAECLALPG